MVLDGRKERRTRALELLDARRPRRPRDAPAGPPVGRRAAAGGDRGRPGERPARRARRRADRRARQPRRRRRCSGCCGGVNAALGTTIVIVTHDAFVSEQVQRTVAIRDGRTSTETFRRTEQTHEGDHRVIAEEYAVLDRAGRLQLPRAHVEALELQSRVRLRLEDDHVGDLARPAGRGRSEPGRAGRARPRPTTGEEPR